MRILDYLNFFNEYKFDELMESLNIWHDALLSSIDAKQLDIFETLNLPIEQYVNNLDIDFLSNDTEFINSLSSLGLKKSEIKNSDDYETFLNKPCKYMFIYDINSNELEDPKYLLFQVWNSVSNSWDDCSLYEVGKEVNNFYDKMTSRNVEIIDNNINYIYQTDNGNEWVLQNIDKESDIYKKVLRKDELKKIVNSRNNISFKVL